MGNLMMLFPLPHSQSDLGLEQKTLLSLILDLINHQSLSLSLFKKYFYLFILLHHLYIYIYIWLHQVLVAAGKIFDLLCSLRDFQLQHSSSELYVGSSSLTLKPGPLHWGHGVLAPGPPGKCRALFIFCVSSIHLVAATWQ